MGAVDRRSGVLEVGFLFALLILKVVVFWLVSINRPHISPDISGGKWYILSGDSWGYIENGKNIIYNRPYHEGGMYPEGRIWGYPLVLAAVMFIFRDESVALNVLVFLQVFLSAFAWVVAARALAGIMCSGKWFRYLVYVMLLAFPHYAFYENKVLTESIYISLSFLSLTAVIKGISEKSVRYLLIGGALMGYAYWVRPVGLAVCIAVNLIIMIVAIKDRLPLLRSMLAWNAVPVICAVLWSSYVWRVTGKITLSQSLMFPFELLTFKDCIGHWWHCPLTVEQVKLSTTAGECWTPAEPSAQFCAWLWMPRDSACLIYPFNCWHDIPVPPGMLTKTFTFKRVVAIRDSIIHYRLRCPADTATCAEKLAELSEHLKEWRRDLLREKPYLVVWGRVRLVLRGMFPPRYISGRPDPQKRQLSNLYYIVTSAYLWFLSLCALFLSFRVALRCSRRLFLRGEGPPGQIDLALLTIVIYGWSQIFAYVVYYFSEPRYYHPSFYIFALLVACGLYSVFVRISTVVRGWLSR